MSSCFRSASSCYLFTLISFLNLFIRRSSNSCWGKSSSDCKSSSLCYSSLISLALSGSCSCLLTTSTSGMFSCELSVYDEATLSVIWDPASLGVFFLRSSILFSSLVWRYWFFCLYLIISFATSWKASSYGSICKPNCYLKSTKHWSLFGWTHKKHLWLIFCIMLRSIRSK